MILCQEINWIIILFTVAAPQGIGAAWPYFLTFLPSYFLARSAVWPTGPKALVSHWHGQVTRFVPQARAPGDGGSLPGCRGDRSGRTGAGGWLAGWLAPRPIGRPQAARLAWISPCSTSASAICTAFSAAPLRRLSDTHQKARPF